mmetsp:Transcript_72395/g.169625  ORF Transcript_72395/g.169625 Transcript_72395/m.169625 type:complete len:763 (+) Transcript_72395:75-2363(+)
MMKARVASVASRSKQAKLASVLPAGTEITRQGATNDFKKGRIMVVKPVARAYILSGRMISNLAIGQWLMKKKWPLMLLVMVGMVLHTTSFLGGFSELGEVAGSSGAVVVSFPTHLSWTMIALTAVCWGLSILAMLTRVHTQLLCMTLHTFDPWAIIACAVRGWAARTVSRYALHHDPAHLTEDILDLVVMLELSALIILAEAADVPKITQKVFIAACLVYCSVLSATPLFLPDLPNWDPDTKVQILFFAEMTPKSQFISAYGTMAVLLTKAAVSVILQKNDFMFLRCHYEYCLDQLDTSFAKLAATDPSCIFYSDFRRALQEMGVSDSHIFAGFNALDIQQSGRVSLQNFRRCLKDVFTEAPDASHVSLLAKFCQEAFCNVSGYASLDSMLGLVLSQWRKIRMNEFGQLLYHYLMQDPGVERLFRSASFRTQSLLFASFVQVGLGWLEEKDFRRVDRDMTSLGMRHVSYGVHPSHLCVFQLALLRALSNRLKGLAPESEMAWSVVWLHFIAIPFTQGLLTTEETEKRVVTGTVRDLLQQATSHKSFLPSLAANLNNVPGGEHNWSSSVFRDAAHELSHMGILVSFIQDTAEKLYAGEMLNARKRLRQVATIHWDRGVFPRHMLTFQHAATMTFREILGPEVFSSFAETMWAIFFQVEVLDVLLLAPFAETQDKVESWALSCKVHFVDKNSWTLLMKMASVDEGLASKGYQRLCAESGKDVHKLSVDDVVKTFCDESMQHPSWTFDRVVQNYCSTPPAVALLE